MKFVAKPFIITLLSNLLNSAKVCASDIGLQDSINAFIVLLLEESILDLAKKIFSLSSSILLVTNASSNCLIQYSYFIPCQSPVSDETPTNMSTAFKLYDFFVYIVFIAGLSFCKTALCESFICCCPPLFW